MLASAHIRTSFDDILALPSSQNIVLDFSHLQSICFQAEIQTFTDNARGEQREYLTWISTQFEQLLQSNELRDVHLKLYSYVDAEAEMWKRFDYALVSTRMSSLTRVAVDLYGVSLADASEALVLLLPSLHNKGLLRIQRVLCECSVP